jgi:predicted DNA-binding transcriptional regulator AlpA
MDSKTVVMEPNANSVMPGALDRHTPRPAVPLRLLRFAEVRRRTGLSRSTIWRLERGGAFPKRIQVSVNVVAWREDEVEAWIMSKLRRA